MKLYRYGDGTMPEGDYYLASEVDAVLKRQAAAAISGMNAAKAISSGQLQQAARLRAESSPDALESERSANAILTAENDRLRWLIGQLLHDLPPKRDWLNPDVEREMRAFKPTGQQP